MLINNIRLENMDNNEKVRFREILSTQFNENLKDLNDALGKHIQSINYKTKYTKTAYIKNKDNDEFKQKKKEYDKKYYLEHKETLLNERTDKYHNDNEYKEQIKLKQKNRYSELNKLKSPLFISDSNDNGGGNS